MLTYAQLEEFAQTNDLVFYARFPEKFTNDAQGPEATSVSICFYSVNPEAWKTLMTNLTEVPVRISGTRTVTSSGATDDLLLPQYRALLPEVNARRLEIGLSPVYG